MEATLLQYGLAGVVILGLVYDRKQLKEEIDKKDAAISLLQQARVDDAKETVSTLKPTLEEISQSIKHQNDKIVAAKRRI